MHKTVRFLYVIICLFKCNALLWGNLPKSIPTVEENFSYGDIRLASKFSLASYNGLAKLEAMKEFNKKGWTCYDFMGKDLLGNSYKAGIVAFSPPVKGQKQQMVIAFRGTETLKDVLIDLYSSQKKYHPFDRIGNIHQGFLYYFDNSIKEIKSLILQYCFSNKKSPSDFNIMTTGHSLGGALATLAGFDLLCDKNFGLEKIDNATQSTVRTVTFGAPRVGDYLFAQEYNNVFGAFNHARLVFPGDVLPHIPFEYWGYKHVGQEIALIDKSALPVNSSWKNYISAAIIRTSIINHSMLNYVEKVKSYMKAKPFPVIPVL